MAIYTDVNRDNPTEQPNVNDVRAITQSITNLLLTRPGEKPFDPEYGIYADDFLFELMDEGSALQLYNEIISKVRKYEPRASLNTSRSEVLADPDNNKFEISLFFEIEGFDDQEFEVTESIGL